jgi:hypothetical protein
MSPYNEGERVLILLCDGIKSSIVLDKAKLAILLLDEEDWGPQWRLGLLDVTCS